MLLVYKKYYLHDRSDFLSRPCFYSPVYCFMTRADTASTRLFITSSKIILRLASYIEHVLVIFVLLITGWCSLQEQ